MKVNKKYLAAAGILTFTGTVIAAAAWMLLNRPSEYISRTQHIEKDISSIQLLAEAADVEIRSAKTDKIAVTYLDRKDRLYSIQEKDGTLFITSEQAEQAWYDRYINLSFRDDNHIMIELPEHKKIHSQIHVKFGDITAAGLQGNLNAAIDYGDIEVSDCEPETLDCTTQCGDIEIEDTAGRSVVCHTDYGDIETERLSGDTITLNTDCGDIEGSIAGNEADYSIHSSADFGDNNLKDKTDGKKTLRAATKFGDISIKFLN